MPAVSVIVPTYNVEHYLRKALDSLVEQTLGDLEVILVNDGSTDGSLPILQEYATAYENFRLIDKPNGGYGAAVNTGIAAATGEYVGILEPDDFVAPEMFAELYAQTRLSAIPQQDILPEAQALPVAHPEIALADIVKSSFYHYWDATKYEPPTSSRPARDQDLPRRITLGTVPELAAVVKDHPSIWSCIYRRQFLLDNDIRFVEAPGAGTVDHVWLFDTMLSAETLVWIPKAYYHYRNDNLAASSFVSNYDVPLSRVEDMLAVFEQHPEADERLYHFFARRTMRMLVSIFNGMELDEPQQDLLDRTDRILQQLKPEAVLENTDIEETRKIFYREVLGLYANSLIERERSEIPRLTILVEAHNNYAYIGGILRSLNKENPLPDIDIVVQDTGGSWDFTGRFVEDVARADHRVSYHAGSWQELIEQVRTDYVYILPSDATLQKDVVGSIVNSTENTDADVVVFDSLQSPDYPLGKVPVSTLYENLFDLISSATNLCVRTNLLRQILTEDEAWSIQRDYGMHLLHLLLNTKTVEFSNLACRRSISRDLGHGSIRTKAVLDPNDLHMGTLTQMKTLLEKRGLYDALSASFQRFAAQGILADLQDYRYELFAPKAELAREAYIPLLLPDLMSRTEFIQRSPEHLLYLLCTNEALFFKYNSQIEISNVRKTARDQRWEIRGLRKEVKALKKVAKKNDPLSRAKRVVKRTIGKIGARTLAWN